MSSQGSEGMTMIERHRSFGIGGRGNMRRPSEDTGESARERRSSKTDQPVTTGGRRTSMVKTLTSFLRGGSTGSAEDEVPTKTADEP